MSMLKTGFGRDTGLSVSRRRSRCSGLSSVDHRDAAALALEQAVESKVELAGLWAALQDTEAAYDSILVQVSELKRNLEVSHRNLEDALNTGSLTAAQLQRVTKRAESQRKSLFCARRREATLNLESRMLQEGLARAREELGLALESLSVAQADVRDARSEVGLARERALNAESRLLVATGLAENASMGLVSVTEKNIELTGLLKSAHQHASSYQAQLKQNRTKLKVIQMHCLRAVRARDKAKESARVANLARLRASTWKLTQGWMYSPKARNAAHLLQKAGCSQVAVGPTIVALARIFGISVNRTMSRRTAQHTSSEGGITSKLQIAYELSKAKGFTVSGDGTTHRKINYEARHINVLVPSYSDPSAPPSHRTRLVGVDQSLDHTSETQVSGWKEHVDTMSSLLLSAPFAKREGVEFKPDDFARKITGMHGDHASDQLKTARAIEAWKKDVIISDLGWQHMAEMSPDELDEITTEAIESEKAKIGGDDAWEVLDADLQRQHIDSALSMAALELRASAFSDLSCNTQRDLTFFVRGGCCMHKELNTVKGGNDTMQAEWNHINAEPPILLANKANVATIEISSASDPAARLAVDASTRGGIKLTSLAGAIFNNKDDKKGHQDYHRWWFEKVKLRLDGTKFSVKFPSTSNTRFQSHCKAAAELIAYQKQYIEFLEHIHDHKEKRAFNHIELNVYNGLRDVATQTELAVLVLYVQSITHPYMREVRGPGIESINLLDLGPLHQRLHSHITYLIENPDVLLNSAEEDYKQASLDGKPWEDSKAMATVHLLKSELPHLKPMLLAFLRGALETWERFSAEFASGGLIDSASPSEKDLAFMPSTNDANEGVLGQMRVSARNNPNETAQNFSAKATFHCNGTQDFMDAKFQFDDHVSLMRTARKVDSSRAATNFRAELMERLCTAVQAKRANDEMRASKKNELFEKLLAVELVQDEDALKLLTVKQLDLQLEVHRVVRKDSEVPIKARLKNKELKYAALVAAVVRLKELPVDPGIMLSLETGHTAQDVLMDEDEEEVLYYQK